MLGRPPLDRGTIWSGVRAALLLGLIVYAVGIYNEVTHYSLNGYGIYPRDVLGLSGIAVSWAIHGSPAHLMNNAVPLVVLGSFVAIRGRAAYIKTTVFVVAISGTMVWLLGNSAVHLGASGIVFGYLGYLLARGVVERSPAAVALAFLAVLLYGGILIGIFPGQEGVSWESHLFGFVAGAIASQYFPRRMRRQPRLDLVETEKAYEYND